MVKQPTHNRSSLGSIPSQRTTYLLAIKKYLLELLSIFWYNINFTNNFKANKP